MFPDNMRCEAVKILYVILGSVALALGVIGMFLPLLPTTPFLLLAAALYFRGSPELYDWLISQKHLGQYIRNFREHRAIPLRAKIISVILLWTTLLYCIICVTDALWLRIVLACVLVGVTVHILSFKTLRA